MNYITSNNNLKLYYEDYTINIYDKQSFSVQKKLLIKSRWDFSLQKFTQN